jgi:CheY-like chemotaxis protein
VTKQILVIEDDQATGILYRAILKEGGYEALYAPNGVQGIATARAARPDVILLDVRLPQMGGPEVAQQLRNHPETSMIPIVVVSANVDSLEHSERQHLKDLCDVFLHKPFAPRQLYDVLNSLLMTTAD